MEKKNYLIVQKAGSDNMFDVAYEVAWKLEANPNVDFFDRQGWSDKDVTVNATETRIWVAQVYSINGTEGNRPTPDNADYGCMIDEEYEVYLTKVEPLNAYIKAKN